jgi:hypothetical protein
MLKNLLNVSFMFSSCLVHSPLKQKASIIYRALAPANRGVILDHRIVDGRASTRLVLWMGRAPVLRGGEGQNVGGDRAGEGRNVGGDRAGEDQAGTGNHDEGVDEV